MGPRIKLGWSSDWNRGTRIAVRSSRCALGEEAPDELTAVELMGEVTEIANRSKRLR